MANFALVRLHNDTLWITDYKKMSAYTSIHGIKIDIKRIQEGTTLCILPSADVTVIFEFDSYETLPQTHPELFI